MPYRNLTSEQMEAVIYNNNMLLSACPGSGKTRTLVSKLYHIIDHSDDLSIGKRKIIAITYTNIAADTIKDRLLSFGVETKSLWVGTIHSLCLQWIINPNINLVPRLCGGFTVIDEHERDAKISELKEVYDFGFFDSIDTSLTQDYKPRYPAGTKSHSLVTDYHKYLADNNYIDFDLILNISYRLLQSNPKLCKRLSRLFYHILVDEYQDTSKIQYEILKLIVIRKHTKITLIGDKEQAIYTGLGAIIKDKDELETFFELNTALEEKRLTGCFRSSQRIIDHYIKYQDEGYAVKSKSDIHDFPSVVHIENEIHKSDLPEYIKKIVEHHLSQGIPENEIVILCPSWFDVIGVSNKLNDLDKNFNIDGFLISPIPKNQDNIWLTLIRLALTKPDIKNYLKRRRYSSELSERINTITQDDELTSPKKILKTINSICVESDDEIENWIENIINKFCEKLNISLDAETVAYREKESLKNSTSERIKKYKMNYRASDLESFFSSASGVKITTSHSTKGDEYEVVICTGLLHGKIPHWNDIKNQTSQHQNYVARRLLYVICSRAKKHLYLISERGHQTGGGFSYTPTQQL